MSFIKINDLDINSDNFYDLVDSLEGSDTEKSKTSIEKDMFCQNCNYNKFENDTSNGIKVCTNCGYINSELVDKNLDNMNTNVISRYGCPTNFYLPKSSLGTKVKNGKYTPLALLERWSQMPYKERSLLEVLKYIEKRCLMFNIPKPIIENSKILFKRINDSKYQSGVNIGKNIIIRGLNRKSLIAACVFHGAIKQNKPRSPKEIAEIFDIEEKQVTRGCRKLRDLMPKDTILCELKTCQSYDFLSRKEFSKQLNISDKHVNLVRRMSLNIKKLGIATDHQPPSVAAGCILLLSEILKLNLEKKLISEIFKISVVTIMKTFKKIYKYKNVIISDKNTNKLLSRMTSKRNRNLIDETDSEKIDSIHSEDYIDSDDIYESKHKSNHQFNNA